MHYLRSYICSVRLSPACRPGRRGPACAHTLFFLSHTHAKLSLSLTGVSERARHSVCVCVCALCKSSSSRLLLLAARQRHVCVLMRGSRALSLSVRLACYLLCCRGSHEKVALLYSTRLLRVAGDSAAERLNVCAVNVHFGRHFFLL